jgi:hypothetical protein
MSGDDDVLETGRVVLIRYAGLMAWRGSARGCSWTGTGY